MLDNVAGLRGGPPVERGNTQPELLHAAARLYQAGELEAAQSLLLEVLRRAPAAADAHLVLGLVLADLGRIGAAIGAFRHVVALAPDEAAGWANLGAMLKVEGRFDAAMKAHDRAVQLAPDDPRIRVNRTVALLRAGRLQDAWPDFEWRLALQDRQGMPLDRLMPPLSRLGDITGRTVLVTHEEGYGDTLQFMRYLPLLADRGARVLVCVPQPLQPIVASLRGVAEVIAGPGPVPEFDFHCPFVSLPRVFDTSLATVPHDVPYIAIDPDRITRWRAALPQDGLRVGLVWSGQARPYLPGFGVLDARRSMHLHTLAPLAAVPGVRFVSLQLGPAADQAHDPAVGLKLCDPTTGIADFADTAALIEHLDVVVSVDTSVAHLAGAMAKPVMLLDRYDSCWRWLSGRVDSPWYPTLRIFRQKRMGDWGPVVQRAATALKALAERRVATGAHPSLPPQCRDGA